MLQEGRDTIIRKVEQDEPGERTPSSVSAQAPPAREGAARGRVEKRAKVNDLGGDAGSRRIPTWRGITEGRLEAHSPPPFLRKPRQESMCP